jgi:hypothetical protein
VKLDALTPDELEAYENWNDADNKGGDCQEIGYSWCAFANEVGGIVIVENDQGFVDAWTYATTDEYKARVRELEEADIAFDEEVEDGE